MTKSTDRFAILLLTALFLALLKPAQAVDGGIHFAQPATIVQLSIQDAIGPATSDYVDRGMDKAAESGARRGAVRRQHHADCLGAGRCAEPRRG